MIIQLPYTRAASVLKPPQIRTHNLILRIAYWRHSSYTHHTLWVLFATWFAFHGLIVTFNYNITFAWFWNFTRHICVHRVILRAGWGSGILIYELKCLLFLCEFDLDRRNIPWLTLFTQHFCSDLDFPDVECAGEESSSTYFYHINSLRYYATSGLNGKFLTATIELHHDCCYVSHYRFLSNENRVRWHTTPSGRSAFKSFLFSHALFTWGLKLIRPGQWYTARFQVSSLLCLPAESSDIAVFATVGLDPEITRRRRARLLYGLRKRVDQNPNPSINRRSLVG